MLSGRGGSGCRRVRYFGSSCAPRKSRKWRRASPGRADEGEILVAHPDDEAAIGKVFSAGGAGLVIDFENESFRGLLDLPFLPPRIGGDPEAGRGNFREGIESVAAG